ncbi:hypothetical protein HanPI659440_Chr05g0207621 [Helianthus annuus]|nr:hypothetical protein HanHA300_Chr05g0182881 [Helianthus annuus]KAJ0577827.1 hypothetical protein HanIR_Chr05g0240381 [Helianthus annuus]KAJ0789793.1 hypothetical protein HanPI659440_Chr05g0207621 [Helianthus annuus]
MKVSVTEVSAVKDDVNVENGFDVDPHVVLVSNGIAKDVNGHLDMVSGNRRRMLRAPKKWMILVRGLSSQL